MSAAALLLALLAIAFALVAFWRVSLRQDVEGMQHQLRRELAALRASQGELLEGASRSLRASREAGRLRLAALAQDLKQLQEHAHSDLEGQIGRLWEQLARLSRAMEQAAKTARDTTLAAAQELERALSRRVRILSARVALLEMKGRAVLAAQAEREGDREGAGARLKAAAERLVRAREQLGGEQEEALAELRSDLEAASASVEAGAGDVQARIERLVADLDRLVGTLGSEEAAAERGASGGEGRAVEASAPALA